MEKTISSQPGPVLMASVTLSMSVFPCTTGRKQTPEMHRTFTRQSNRRSEQLQMDGSPRVIQAAK